MKNQVTNLTEAIGYRAFADEQTLRSLELFGDETPTTDAVMDLLTDGDVTAPDGFHWEGVRLDDGGYEFTLFYRDCGFRFITATAERGAGDDVRWVFDLGTDAGTTLEVAYEAGDLSWRAYQFMESRRLEGDRLRQRLKQSDAAMRAGKRAYDCAGLGW